MSDDNERPKNESSDETQPDVAINEASKQPEITEKATNLEAGETPVQTSNEATVEQENKNSQESGVGESAESTDNQSEDETGSGNDALIAEEKPTVEEDSAEGEPAEEATKPADNLETTADEPLESEQIDDEESADTAEEPADATVATVAKTSKESDKHSPAVVVVAILVVMLLVAIAFMGYRSDTEVKDQTELPSANIQTEEVAQPLEPATDADLQKAINSVDAVIEEINSLGAPADGLDDESLGL